MNFKMNWSYTLLIFLSFDLYSKVNIKVLKDQLSNKSNQITKLAAQIKDFDKRIGMTNNDFLVKIKEIEETELILKELKKKLQQTASDISDEHRLTVLAFDFYLLESKDQKAQTDIKKKVIRFEILKKNLLSLRQAQKDSKNLLSEINKLDQQLDEKKKEEQEIYALISELEERKRSMSQEYVSELESKNLLEGKISKYIVRSKVKRKMNKSLSDSTVDYSFLLPMSAFVDAKKKKRGGIDFKYSETSPIKSPGNGRIVYVGELASYGKVLIIDHGKDVRSVLFGDIVAKVKKNAPVKQGDILGYTMGDPGVMKSIYYEVRKNNKVQNTVMWLAQNQRGSINI